MTDKGPITNSHMEVLPLTLKKRWFELIRVGRKKNEYREVKDYWTKRLVGKDYTHILFTNGYGKHRPSMLVELKRVAKAIHWFEGKPCFNLILGDIIEVKNLEAIK